MKFTQKIKNLFFSQIFWVFIFSFIIREILVFSNYPFVFHPDEPTVINSTINLRYSLNPKHFDWPTTYYYLNYPIYSEYEKNIRRLNSEFKIPVVVKEIDYYIISRTLTAVLGSLTVVLVFLILKNLSIDHHNSITGSVVFSLFTFGISRSSLALIDIPMLFFCTLSVYYLTKNLNNDSNWNYYWSCFFAGVAVSTKYNGYMVFLTIALYLIWIRKLNLKDLVFYLKCGAASFLGFFLGTPYFIFDAKTFFDASSPKGAVWQFKNVGKVGFTDQFFGFFQNIYESLSLVSYIPLLIGIAYILLMVYKVIFVSKFKITSNKEKILIIFVIQYLFVYWSVSGVEMQRSQYLILSFLFLPIFWVFFFEYFPKLKSLILLIYLIISGYMLLNLNQERPIVQFYRNVTFSAPLVKYNFLYTDPDFQKILTKLDISSDRYNGKSFRFNPIYTHLLSSTDLCFQKSDCNLKLIEMIESKSREDKLYIYEIKR